jgi:hypothetical protein
MPVATGYCWRRAISRGACPEACGGGWRLCRCQPDKRSSKAKPIWMTKEVEGVVSDESLRNGANHGLLALAKALPGATDSTAIG